MDLNKKCCETCANEDCRTRKTDSMAGVFLRHDYCEYNGYPLWKPRYQKEQEEPHEKGY